MISPNWHGIVSYDTVCSPYRTGMLTPPQPTHLHDAGAEEAGGSMTLAGDLEALGITDETILRRARQLEQTDNYWRAAVFGFGKLAAAALVASVVDPPVTGDR